MRVKQPIGTKGSLKWLQIAVNHAPHTLQPTHLPDITWLSPLQADELAEYRDGAFLERLSLEPLRSDLQAFWPRGGPQWDALGMTDHGPVLVEAKAHLSEFFSPGTQASEESRRKICASLNRVKSDLGVTSATDWSQTFYQYTNRIAHLWWLRQHGIDARLLFVSFLNDTEMSGPRYRETWDAAFATADHALGLKAKHRLSRYICHMTPDIRQLSA